MGWAACNDEPSRLKGKKRENTEVKQGKGIAKERKGCGGTGHGRECERKRETKKERQKKCCK